MGTIQQDSSSKELETDDNSHGHNSFSLGSLTETFQGSISFVISTATFGAALFSLVVSQIREPQPPHGGGSSSSSYFGIDTIRVFLALAWLSFALCLAIVGFSLTFLKVLNKKTASSKNSSTTRVKKKANAAGEAAADNLNEERFWHAVGLLIWALLYGLITLAFVFLSLVLVAYVGTVGWVALGFACLVGILSVVWLILEAR
ncbi:hypothetical protein B0H66DRAFT_526599 [Apodospora peruviana]|uniref:Transmembrane protein n=1 Tax=Apodospora peruviana TaxID=516989 RepID=A0AAE0IQJ0_9PEZI|nr:hypothetical protein B0H66DRAFT_526599 [Apodospora peruviana]